MAGLKRKESPAVKHSGDRVPKKPRTGHAQIKREQRPVSEAEAETDSDPIIESDTTEHSGDDDGVSWPSDDEKTTVASKKGESGVENEVVKRNGTTTKSNKNPVPSNGAANSTSSREAHVKQKALAQERRAAKPNSDSVARSKKLWERLRRKSHVPLEERKVLVAELFEIITGRVKDFVFKHDSVRVIQTALKYANLDQRKMIAKELKGEYRGLAESKYAKFLVGKLLVHGDAEIRDLIVPEFYGYVRRMMKHPEGSWILDDIYRGMATPHQKAILLREWYGAEFAIFKTSGEDTVSSDLKALLDQHPEKRTPILRSLHELTNQLVQKKTTGFTILHDAMLQYFLNLQPAGEEAVEFIELLKGDEEGDLLKNLAFTKSGARLVCLALAYGNAKDRKHILKTYKNTIQTLAFDTYGHQVLLAAYDVIDDTVLTSKSIFPELLGKDSAPEQQHETIMSFLVDLNARIPLLHLFASKAKSILTPGDMVMLDEIHRIRATTSKKEPETRRKELLKALSPPLLSFIAKNAENLVQTSFGSLFITEVLLGAEGEKQEALEAIADLANASEEVRTSLESPAAGRMLKSLVLGGKYNPATKVIETVDLPLGFHKILYAKIKDRILDWATGSNSFVVVGLLEADGFPDRDEVKTTLAARRKELGKAATRVGPAKGDMKEEKGKTGKEGGNKGTQLLLQKLG
ncbi:pumilio domain-containing protein [Lasallia pustulata]|uniref:Pumilio domain-containing protein n=1 Tax=Lasallia pustulata TaxID=136370 RepID=A0A1W5CY71_9LECA|nr:pumilio domain-containing protein [Lasallia pustulata]